MTTPGTVTPDAKLTTERLNEMAYAYKQTGCLLAAIELGLFEAISTGTGKAKLADIARQCDLPEETTDRLLTVCKALHLIKESHSAYENVPDVERYLVCGKRTYFGDFLLYQTRENYDDWKELGPTLRGDGGPAPERRYATRMRDPVEARKFTEAGYNSSISLAHRFAKMFDFSPYTLWLDFAGGSGCYSIAACERYAHLKTIILDQPNVIPVTRDFVAKHQLGDRIRIAEGNFLNREDYLAGCDLISFITPLQGYMPDDLVEVFGHSYAALEPGGTLLVLDYMLHDAKDGPLDPAFLNISGIRNGHYLGRVNSGAEFKAFMTQVGFQDIDVRWLLAHQLGVITGKKPA